LVSVSFQREVIDTSSIMSEIGRDGDGCCVAFTGMPRNTSGEKEVLHLEYELYESMAYREMKKIADQAMQKWPLGNCVIVHRYGRVEIGEASIFIVVSSPHRAEAYEASRFIIDTVKKTVPIWKKEVFSDGTSWISDRV